MIHIRRLDWDSWNVAHIARHARHHVTPDEVEEVCHGQSVDLQSYAGRIILIGLTNTRRVLAVVVADEGEGVFYPVTARPASRKERRYYDQQTGGAAR